VADGTIVMKLDELETEPLEAPTSLTEI